MTDTKVTAEEAANCVFIGKKPTMSYVFAVTTQAQTQDKIRIRARGRSISKAVDVSQIALHRFLNNWGLDQTLIGTQEKEAQDHEEGDPTMDRVSFIDIILRKGELKKE